MKRYFYPIVLLVFVACTTQTCAPPIDDPTPTVKNNPTIMADKNNNYLLYEYSVGASRHLRFAINGVDDATIINVEAADAITAFQCSKSGAIIDMAVTMTAKESFNDKTTLAVTATNSHGSTTQTYDIEAAVMRLAQTEFEVSSNANVLNLDFTCNISADIRVDEGCNDMLSLSVDGNKKLIAIVSKNPELQPRTGTITFSDIDGIIPPVTVTVNQFANNIPSVLNSDTDKQALISIYSALHNEKWSSLLQRQDLQFNERDFEAHGYTTRIFTGIGGDRVGYLAFGGGDYGVFPDELGWLDQLKWIECGTPDKDCPEGGIHGSLPKTLGGCKSLTRLDLWGTHICEKLNDSPIRDVISHVRELTLGIDHYGTFPEWLTNMPENGYIHPSPTHLSGQIPDRVAKMKPMEEGAADLDDNNVLLRLNGCEFFFELSKGHYNYALWIGEQPANVKFVSDEHEGHWEWTDTVFDQETQRWKREGDIWLKQLRIWIAPRK